MSEINHKQAAVTASLSLSLSLSRPHVGVSGTQWWWAIRERQEGVRQRANERVGSRPQRCDQEPFMAKENDERPLRTA